MATIKEYDSFKTQDGREINLYQAVNADGEWNNLYDRHPIYCPECGTAPLKTRTRNGQTEYKRLRTRSFYSIYELDDEDMGFPIVFYGKVFLSFERTKSKTSDFEFNILKVFSIYRDKRQLQSIFLGQHEIDVEENHPYLFSMLGVTERNGKYNNVKLYNQYRPLFRIEEPDD